MITYKEQKKEHKMQTPSVNFHKYLNEKLKNPEFEKGLKRADKKVKLQIELNDLLQKRGIKEFFVEIKDMSEY